MSTTPRTDEQILAYRTEDGSELVHASFARQLETELAHLNDEMERLKKDTSDMGAWVGSKMLQPEWDSFKQSLEVIEHWKTRAEKAEAECLEQARLLGLSGNEVAMLLERNHRLSSLWNQFFFLLDILEESDSGVEFRPNTITSCRALDSERMEKILAEAKQLINANVNKHDL
jgi:hypothetical protein